MLPGDLLGRNANGPAVGSSTSVYDVMGGDRAAVYSVESGPNEGYAMVEYGSYSVFRYRQINERLQRTGPEEIPDGDSTVRHWNLLKSKGYAPEMLLAGIMAHEGYGQSGAKGHQGQIEKALTVEACGDAMAITARIVAPNEEEATELRDQTEGIADTAFIMSTLHDKVHGNMGNAGAVAVLWKPNESPKYTVVRDRRDPDQRRNFSSPGCDWSSF